MSRPCRARLGRVMLSELKRHLSLQGGSINGQVVWFPRPSVPSAVVTATMRAGAGESRSAPQGTESLKRTPDLDEENNERQRIFQRVDPELSESNGSFSREWTRDLKGTRSVRGWVPSGWGPSIRSGLLLLPSGLQRHCAPGLRAPQGCGADNSSGYQEKPVRALARSSRVSPRAMGLHQTPVGDLLSVSPGRRGFLTRWGGWVQHAVSRSQTIPWQVFPDLLLSSWGCSLLVAQTQGLLWSAIWTDVRRWAAHAHRSPPRPVSWWQALVQMMAVPSARVQCGDIWELPAHCFMSKEQLWSTACGILVPWPGI